MSLFIAIVVLTLLLWTELFTAEQIQTDVSNRIVAVFMVSVLAPAFAAFQIWSSRRRRQDCGLTRWRRRGHWMAIFCGLVWAAATLLIASVLKWPNVVEQLPFTGSVPLLGDVVILCPVLVSLATSWAILIFGAPSSGLSAKRSRREMYSLWLRMRLLLVTVPILLALFVVDLLRLVLQQGVGGSELSLGNGLFIVASMILVLFSVAIGYPWLLIAIWKTRPANAKLAARVERLFNSANCGSCRVRIWNTGRNVANAAVIGVVPGTQVLLLSDLMVELFPKKQLDAIVLHEIGHLKRRHLLKRIFWIAVPLMLLMLDQQVSFGLHDLVARSNFLATLTGFMHPYLLPVAYVIYLFLISKFCFRNMEFEADRFAAEAAEAEDLASALERFDAICPQHGKRGRGFHPPIHDRIAALDGVGVGS